MNIRRVSTPVPAVSLAEAKAHLRVDGDIDDALIEDLVAGAIDHLVGWSGVLGRAMEAETVEMTLDTFPSAGVIDLPLGPIVPASVVIGFQDELGVDQSLANDGLFVGVNGNAGGRVWPRGTWPRTLIAPDAVRVRWTAGLGATASDKQMILQVVGTGYLHREASGDAGQDVPFSANRRAFATRVWNL